MELNGIFDGGLDQQVDKTIPVHPSEWAIRMTWLLSTVGWPGRRWPESSIGVVPKVEDPRTLDEDFSVQGSRFSVVLTVHCPCFLDETCGVQKE